jgi:hypothetical protein
MKTQKNRKSGKHKTRKQFLYNPNNPKKSFDVYIDWIENKAEKTVEIIQLFF